MLRTAGVVALVALLAVTTASANAVVVADRTVLDPGFVREGLEDAEAYRTLHESVVDSVGAEAGNGTAVAGVEIDRTAVVDDAIPPSYLEAQTEANVNRTFAYLTGARDDLVISFDTSAVAENAGASVADQINETPSSTIIRALVGDGSLREAGVEVELSLLARMAANESAYEDARATVRGEVEAAVVARMADEAFASASDDELLALVVEDYDPSAYSEAEKSAMVDDREAEITAALRERVREERADDVDAAVAEQLDALRASANDRVADIGAGGGMAAAPGGEAVVAAATGMVQTSVEGLTTDLSYEAYDAQLEADKAAFAESAGSMAGEQLAAELPADVDVTGELDPSARRTLGLVRTGVRTAGILVFALPVFGLLLVGGLWWLTRSRAVTAGGTGGALVIGALPGLVIAGRVPAMARDAMAGPDPGGVNSIVVALIERAAGVLWTQSLVVAGVGVALALVGLVLYLDDRGTITLPSR